MQTSHKLTSLCLSLVALLLLTTVALANDPGTPFTPNDFDGVEDQKPGGLLIFNLYSSSAANPAAENTRISITNTDDQNGVSVHLYFIDGSTCGVADNYLCLTKNQTVSIYASDVDPGVKGYVLAMTTFENGEPNLSGRLLGDEFVKLASGHVAQLPAQAIKFQNNFVSPQRDFFLLGVQRTPRVLAIPNLPSPAEGNNTMLVLNRLGGDLRTSMGSIGDIFGILYDQLENPYSWSSRGGCQLMTTIGQNFPRTVPRVGAVIPAGSVGWMKFWITSGSDITPPGGGSPNQRAFTGCYLTFNPNAGNSATAFNGGRNLSQLTFNRTEFEYLTVPIFPSNCGFVEN